MIYTKLTKEAMRLCFEKHKDQIDKCGVPYPFHPFHVAEAMKDEATTCVALLHDIIEDTDTTAEDLYKAGFSSEIVEAVLLMSHDESVPYLDYVKALRTNPIARAVKISDLTHNSDLTRFDSITEWDLKRNEKYKAALKLLTEDEEQD